MAETKTSGRLDPEWECPCGRFKTDWPASKAKHLLACDGTPVQTRGRIDRLAHRPPDAERTPPAARRPRKAARRAVSRRKAVRALAVVAAPTAGSSLRLTFLGQLHSARERIDTAIAAVEALG